MQYFPIIILFLIFFILIARIITVLFHELGHAIPAIILTKEKVSVYIGSYGNSKKSVKLNIGLLEIWFRYNPFAWRSGLCIPTAKEISINRKIVYILAGPFASISIAFIAIYFAFSFEIHGSLKILLVVFFVSAILDLIVNLIPDSTPITLDDGTITHNDGYSLKQLFYFKFFSKKYEHAVNLYNRKKYLQAAPLFKKMLNNGILEEGVYRLAISSFIQIQNYDEAKALSDDLILLGNMTSDDFSNAGLANSQLGLHDMALEFYDKSLDLNSNNNFSLHNKGYTLNLMRRYDKAIICFDRVIESEPTYAYSYSNRGLSKIKLGHIEEGLTDIHYSLQLEPDNSYAYMNLGIYHYDKTEYSKAFELFKKAKELDKFTYNIDELINKVKKQIV